MKDAIPEDRQYDLGLVMDTAFSHVSSASPKAQHPRLFNIGDALQGSRASATARSRLELLVQSTAFECTIGVLIILNCATISIQVEESIGTDVGLGGFSDACEYFFTLAFSLELAARICVAGLDPYVPPIPASCSREGWVQAYAQSQFTLFNLLDACLVIVSVVICILQLAGGDAESFRIVTMLRAMRLFRLANIIRRFHAFREVYLLLRGLSDSMRVLVWTLLVLAGITYIFAVFGVVLIASVLKDAYEKSPTDELSDMLLFFGGTHRVMFTLIQMMTLDSWTAFSRPLEVYVPMAWIYLYLYFAVATVVLLNLVTAILVEAALSYSKQDADFLLKEKEMARQANMDQFQSLFGMLDKDQNGMLVKSEFDTAFENPDVGMKLKLLDFGQEDLLELFYLLDSGDGALSMDEFFGGLTKMEGDARAKDVYRCMKSAETFERYLKTYSAEMQQDLYDIQSNVAGCHPQKRRRALKKRALHSKLHGSGDGGSPFCPASPTGPMLDFGSFVSQPRLRTMSEIERSTPAGCIHALSDQLDRFSREFGDRFANYERRVGDREKKIAALLDEVAMLRRLAYGEAASQMQDGEQLNVYAAQKASLTS
eukprot:TRINITY_DN14152_c1_g4_i1.p1 TRINITY_DN14152_c1_g4~~TRINITY_DN14152_c1_g4_i1.p1  ORF type:complete len:599 (+),score=106.71 TRINITY_DN14152_c1_g4_i1:102-1898(+)